MSVYLLGTPWDCWINFRPLKNSSWCCPQIPLRDSISLLIRHTSPEFPSISQSKWKISAPKSHWCPFDTVATGNATLLLKAAFLQNFKNISLCLGFNICTEWNTIISSSYPSLRLPISWHIVLSPSQFFLPHYVKLMLSMCAWVWRWYGTISWDMENVLVTKSSKKNNFLLCI